MSVRAPQRADGAVNFGVARGTVDDSGPIATRQPRESGAAVQIADGRYEPSIPAAQSLKGATASDSSSGEIPAAAFHGALAAIRRREPAYAKAICVTESDPCYIDPQRFCDETLAEALSHRMFLQTRARRLLFDRASDQAPNSRLIPVLACHDYLARGEVLRARKFAQRAVYLNQDDLYAQRLYRCCHPELPPEPELKGKFCSQPFATLETVSRGRVFFCCPTWQPISIGNLGANSANEIWNSAAAQDVRRSILDGSYRYCSRMHCPRLTADELPRTREVKDAEFRKIIADGLVRLPRGPRHLFLSHDRSCNLSCPSCRTTLIVAKKVEVDRMNAMAERVILPLARTTRRVHITGSGDPFASHHFRHVIRRLTSGDTPNLRISLQTNGLLLKASWDDLGLEGYVEWVAVSIDAIRPETYSIVRRGGRFDALLENLAFLSELRRANRVKHVRLDFVVQALNYGEMPEAAELTRSFGFDRTKFQLIRSWNTYAPEEFAKHDIGCPDHPEFGAFLCVLKDPRLAGSDVEFYGFYSVDRELPGRNKRPLPSGISDDPS